jgi:hypothetical protein
MTRVRSPAVHRNRIGNGTQRSVRRTRLTWILANKLEHFVVVLFSAEVEDALYTMRLLRVTGLVL